MAPIMDARHTSAQAARTSFATKREARTRAEWSTSGAARHRQARVRHRLIDVAAIRFGSAHAVSN